MALTAKEMNKPFYVVAESFKFARLYPLNQTDVPNHFKVRTNFHKIMIHNNSKKNLHYNIKMNIEHENYPRPVPIIILSSMSISYVKEICF